MIQYQSFKLRKCKDFFIKVYHCCKYGASYYAHPATHCHHREPEERPNLCRLKHPRAGCIDYEMKIARNWCKDCVHWGEQ